MFFWLFVCLLAFVLAYWLLSFMSVYSLIFIWLHTNGETRKYAQFVCECLGVPRPSRASPRTAPGLKQCTAPACEQRRDRLAQLSSASQRQRGTGQQSVGLNAALGARAHQPETEPRVPGRTCQICCEAPCEGSEWAGWLVVSCGFHFLAIERIFSPSAARCCTTSETFLLFPTKFPQHGTQAKSR